MYTFQSEHRILKRKRGKVNKPFKERERESTNFSTKIYFKERERESTNFAQRSIYPRGKHYNPYKTIRHVKRRSRRPPKVS